MSIAGPSRDIGSPSPPLQRGKACLSCRRRKMKCDGIRPTCTQCTRGDRAEDCEYTDGSRRARTLVLEEDIARLRARVQELENPQNVIPSIELYPPYTSPSIVNPSVAQTPYQPLTEPPPTSLSTSSPATSSTDSGWGFDGPPQRNVQQCLTVLAPHAAELGLFLNIDRLRAQNTPIFSGLHSMLTLWSAYLSQGHLDVSEQNLESALLSHAQHKISNVLSVDSSTQDPQVFMHIIQTELLISCHLQRTGEPLGARYHASAALSLALGLRLHVKSGEAPSAHLFDFVGNSYPRLPPPLDSVEEKERVDAFWTVYCLDRCLGDIYNGPPGMNHAIMITAPWPSSDWSNEGQSSFMTPSANVTNINTVLQFLTGQDRDLSNDSPLGLQAKASVLLSEAASIAASYAADPIVGQSAAFRGRFATLGNLIQWFSASLPPPSSIIITPGIIQPSNARQVLLTINLTALAQITLHRTFAPTHAPSNKRCIEGALHAVRALDGVSDPGPVSPICVMIWTALCRVLHDELVRLRSQASSSSTADTSYASSLHATSPQAANREEEVEISHAINKIFSIMSKMKCPAKAFAAKFKAMIPVLDSIN